MNVQEHPNATIGLVAISVLGASKELILAVADNGDSIPSTIFGRYLREHPTCSAAESPAAARYEPSSLSREARADITDFATQPGVSRKDDRLADQTGMGLTYIKQDTIKTFCGKLRILTDSVSLRYSPDASDQPEQENWPHRWRGNLLRIAIPLHRSPTPAAADADSP
jgi:hypothetical protein